MREKWPQGARACPRCSGTLWEDGRIVTFNNLQYSVVDRCTLCLNRGYVMSGIPDRIVPRHEVGGIIQQMLRALKDELPEPQPEPKPDEESF